MGAENRGILARVLRKVGNLASQDALTPVLIDRLVGEGRVGEHLFLEILNGRGAANHGGDGVGQREQVADAQRGQRVAGFG